MTKTNTTVKEDRTFSPKAVLKELKAVRWAKMKTVGKDVGVVKNFFTTVVFIALFAGFFELCSLLNAVLLHLGGN